MAHAWIFMLIMIPCAALMTGIGVYAWRREKPMWFWSGTEVKPEEITDVRAYNRANGIMWICYSLFFWAAALISNWSGMAAGVVVLVGGVFGSLGMMVAFQRIYQRYSADGKKQGT